MPKIYEYFGLIFLMYFDDHKPIHVHVKMGKYESIIEIVTSPSGKVSEIRKRKGVNPKDLPSKELKTAIKFVNAKAEEIIRKWDLMQKDKYNESPIKITRKIV